LLPQTLLGTPSIAAQPDRIAACTSAPGTRAGSRQPTWTNLFKYAIQ